jgi:hypothetical protein
VIAKSWDKKKIKKKINEGNKNIKRGESKNDKR